MAIPMYQCWCTPCSGTQELCSCECHKPWPVFNGPMANSFSVGRSALIDAFPAYKLARAADNFMEQMADDVFKFKEKKDAPH